MRSNIFRKSFIISLITLFLCSIVISGSNIQTNNIINYNRGNTLYVGGNGPGNYTTIQSAIDAANIGDTVFVYAYSSPYKENIIINKKINLIGEEKTSTIIEKHENEEIIFVNSDLCKIEGFTIMGENYSFDITGINISSSNNLVINNIFLYNNIGIYLWENSKNNNISKNTISNSLIGIYSNFDSNNNDISGNDISLCDLYGIYILSSNDNSIFTNIISNNYLGMRIKGSTGNIVFNNSMRENDQGILCCCEANNNIIYNNIFKKNEEWNGADEGTNNQWDDGKKGNYWDDYNGTDENGDGIGDTPYILYDGINKDKYPLMKPLGNHPPISPLINGPTKDKIGVQYIYTFYTSDIDNDSIYYYVDWGDGNTIDWQGPYNSGSDYTASHTWYSKSTITIKCKAKDEYGAESGWGTLNVVIPISKKPSNILLEKLLQNLPYLITLINKLTKI